MLASSVTANRAVSGLPTIPRRIDLRALSVWLVVGGLVMYLAVEGGGYDIVVRSQVSIVVWWLVVAGAACGLLPAARLTRRGWATLALFGAFVAWIALACTWSISSQDSLAELSRDVGYLGVLLLITMIHRDRAQAVRHTINALSAAIVAIACLALASRLHPSLFPAAATTASFLPDARGRLGWPLNYWNGLGALLAMGIPLLLSQATSARTLRAQSAAAAAIPLLLLCGYLTFSRGAAIAGALAILTFIALAPERFPKLATLLVSAGGGVALIAGATHHTAFEHGFTGSLATHQGSEMLVAIVLVCAGVAAAQAAIGLAVRHGTPPPLLIVPRRRARQILAGAIVVAIAFGLAANGPGHLSHLWHDFKAPSSVALNSRSLERFTSASGNQRYQLWKVAANAATGKHLLRGWGPGTYQQVYLPRAYAPGYVINAHSLFFETLSDVGLVGLALLVGFFAVVLFAAVRLVTRSRWEARTRAAAVAAALLAFTFSAGVDWMWQLPVLAVAFLALAATVLVPSAGREGTGEAWQRSHLRRSVRAGSLLLGVVSIAAISVPLALTNDIASSQAASAAGDRAAALRDAKAAARLEPGAAGPQIQLALVQELQRHYVAAAAAAQRATADEPDNWSAWLVRSRIAAEAGDAHGSLEAYRRARVLNPKSELFAS